MLHQEAICKSDLNSGTDLVVEAAKSRQQEREIRKHTIPHLAYLGGNMDT